MQAWMQTCMTSDNRTNKYTLINMITHVHYIQERVIGYITYVADIVCPWAHIHRHAFEHAHITHTAYKPMCHIIIYCIYIYMAYHISAQRQGCTAWGRCFHRALRWFAGLWRIPLSSVWSNYQPGDTVWRAMLREWPLRVLQWGVTGSRGMVLMMVVKDVEKCWKMWKGNKRGK